jgi:hypothetical protein
LLQNATVVPDKIHTPHHKEREGKEGGGSKVVKINYCRMSEVGSVLASNFLHGGHVDVFWNDLSRIYCIIIISDTPVS